MTDPFVQPAEPTAADAIAAIREDLELFDDWEGAVPLHHRRRPQAARLPRAPWLNDAHRVPGCQSKVWMEAAMDGPVLKLAGASDAAIVSGLVALLLRVYSGRTPAEIVATDPVFLRELGLLEALSTNRGNGIAAMTRAIREAAQSQLSAQSRPDRLARPAGRVVHRQLLRRGGDHHGVPAIVDDRSRHRRRASRHGAGRRLAGAAGGGAGVGRGRRTVWGGGGRCCCWRRPARRRRWRCSRLAHGLAGLLLLVTLQGIAAAALSPLADTLTLALAADRAAGLRAHPRHAGSASYMVATAVAGSVLGWTGSAAVPVLIAAGYGAAALLVPAVPEPARAPRLSPRSSRGMGGLLRLPGLRASIAASALIQGSHAAYYGFAAIQWRAAGIPDDGVIGLLIAEGIVMEVVLFVWGGRLVCPARPGRPDRAGRLCLHGALDRAGLHNGRSPYWRSCRCCTRRRSPCSICPPCRC